MQQYIVILIFFCYIERLLIPIAADYSACGTSTNSYCISNIDYQQCKCNGSPQGDINNCNPGSYCSISGSCPEIEEPADYNQCNLCDSTKTFACTGTKSFKLCLGEENPSDIGAQCTGDLVCDITNSNICVEGTATCPYKNNPTEAPATPPPTVPSPASNSTAFCAAMGAEGLYPIGTDTQTTCHQYVQCLYINDEWYGPIYNCPGNSYYDSSKHSCVATPPSTCSIAVEHLSFRSILLE